MSRREQVIQKVVKMLRLARAAGSEAEAHTALTLAQRLMYAHDIDAHELEEPEALQPIDDAVVDTSGQHVPWKEVLAAIIAENFRCVIIISESRSTGAVRLVLVGRSADAAVANEAFQASALVAAHLAEEHARSRPPERRDEARASFLTGFLRGLCARFDESTASSALLVIADAAVVREAGSLANGGEASGGALPASDPDAMKHGFASGYDHGSGTRGLGR